ncbi:glycosyltransferase [Winogradskyella sp. DF17]|uniref:Glycosyltransferase n=1 Tax=Winogradskyella pelagia TaxID=2819984 RepID=A0ABS3T1R4_9FLAO|nr:glycosyltransferase family 2 protein [Winogradskyella sp. DF17]MBO3116691.1 glycosyltransferase [Winogradskyella sp. DF17]
MKLSIITINYNNAIGLKKTMESIASQSWRDFEHIVIDGNSSDHSSDIVKSFNYPQLSYLSEADSGIYNAMNKGIDKASGKYLLFLNSGDTLENPEVLDKVNPYFAEDYSVLSGHIIFDEPNGKRLREHPEKMTFSYLVGNAVSHPSTFIKRDLFQKYGKYNERFKIVSDWAFFLKVLGLNDESYLKLPETITVFDVDGVSTQKDNLEKIYKERNEVLKAYFPRVYNNEDDRYIFNHFISTNNRFRYLKVIEKFPLFRKITTVILGIIAFILKPFKSSK